MTDWTDISLNGIHKIEDKEAYSLQCIQKEALPKIWWWVEDYKRRTFYEDLSVEEMVKSLSEIYVIKPFSKAPSMRVHGSNWK